MIDCELASNFITKVSTFTKYNINIMDAKGTIIASKDEDRIGKYHEIAFNLIQSGESFVEVFEDDDYLGVKRGISVLIYDEGKPAGVLGMTGDPETVHEIAFAMKASFELFLQYEREIKKKISQQTSEERLYEILFSEVRPNPEKLESMAIAAGYSAKLVRIPILFVLGTEQGKEDVFQQIQTALSVQDMCWDIDKNHVLLYKALAGDSQRILSSWREEIQAFLTELYSKNVFEKALVGSLQYRLHYYKEGENYCRWLEKSVPTSEPIQFFYDFLEDYIESFIPIKELQFIWNTFDHLLSESTKQNIVENFPLLRKNNYSLVHTAKELFIHKNTLAYRIEKLKNELGINPFSQQRDRIFVESLCSYLRRIHG